MLKELVIEINFHCAFLSTLFDCYKNWPANELGYGKMFSYKTEPSKNQPFHHKIAVNVL